MKQDIPQAGFTTSVFLVGLVALLAIGGIGSYLYSQRDTTRKPAAATTVKQATPDGQSTSPGGVPAGASGTPATTAPSSTDATVTVAGAGFQITVPAVLKDLTYHVNGGSVTFSTATLAAAIPTCAANSGSGAFETITKGSGTYKPPSNPANGGLLKQYDTYYLAYTLRTGPCAKGLSVANQNLLDDQTQAFYGALASVK